MLPVDQKTGSKLHHRDDPGSNNAAGDSGREADTAQPAQHKKANSTKKEHAAVAAAAPQQFQSYITCSAGNKEQGVFPQFQEISPQKDYSQKL